MEESFGIAVCVDPIFQLLSVGSNVKLNSTGAIFGGSFRRHMTRKNVSVGPDTIRQATILSRI